ncbi:unnamed protein product [Sphagnum jensenii]|uniref:Uncharacterized protein n=1 Tax=Sphagnum jensenii TaxID=128206 RepID=A0ABP0WTE7_9BRYO
MGQTQNGHLLAFSHSAALPQHVHFPASRAYIARSLASSVPLLSLSLASLSLSILLHRLRPHALPPPATGLPVLHYRSRIYRERERVAKSLSDPSAEYSRLIAGRDESHDYVNVWSRSRDSSMELPLSCSLLDFTLEIRLGSHGVCDQKFLRKLCQCLSMSSRWSKISHFMCAFFGQVVPLSLKLPNDFVWHYNLQYHVHIKLCLE